MEEILKEIFRNLILINGIIGLIYISYKILIKLYLMVYYEKKDNETFEKRWEESD